MYQFLDLSSSDYNNFELHQEMQKSRIKKYFQWNPTLNFNTDAKIILESNFRF